MTLNPEINARPNMNGNTIEDFRAVSHALRKASAAVKDARAQWATDAGHFRNYQHLPIDEANRAREEDIRTVDARLVDIANELQVLAGVIARASI